MTGAMVDRYTIDPLRLMRTFVVRLQEGQAMPDDYLESILDVADIV